MYYIVFIDLLSKVDGSYSYAKLSLPVHGAGRVVKYFRRIGVQYIRSLFSLCVVVAQPRGRSIFVHLSGLNHFCRLDLTLSVEGSEFP